jgi:Fe-S-cluster containining protein
MAAEAHSTATLRLTVGDLQVVHPITVPSGQVPATEVVPALQGLVNAVVAAAEAGLTKSGKTISCRKGCGACCRQLVPVSRTEGERLLALVGTMDAERRERLHARFASAEAVLDGAGLSAGLLDRAGRSDRELSLAYFARAIPCPFLEEESCSIHSDRPLVCREYLVTSPAELCAGPAQEGVTPVAVPKVSAAARGLQEENEDWLALALLMKWARIRPPGGAQRTGPEWVQRFLSKIGRPT